MVLVYHFLGLLIAEDPRLIPSQRNIYPKGTKIGIQATRGCPYRCEFCTMANIKHRNVFRTRPIENVINEMELYPYKTTAFYDDSLTVNPEYSKQLFKAMKDLNKKFTANGNIGVLSKDDELLKLASEAGCFGWFIGFESISQESLNSVGKPNNVSVYFSAIKKIHDYGMMVMGGFVLGFDDDTIDIFNKTDDFVRKSEIDFAYYNILTPFPGTQLYTKYENEGRILTKDWSKYDLNHVVFQPKHMSPNELLTNVQRIRKNYFKTSHCIERIIKSIKFGFNPFILLVRENIMLKLEK